MKFVPEGTTDIAQPLDTYFHRQLKYLTKKFFYFNSLHVAEDQNELSSRNGVLKLHSLIHFLLSAPIFAPMIKYCWFSSGLWNDADPKPEFRNVNEVCFSSHRITCESDINCPEPSFITCSWCEKVSCYKHFFTDNHMLVCSNCTF